MGGFMKINKYFIFFMLYAAVGWIYETVLEVFIYKWGYSNRGFLVGPYLPVYGFGALLFIFVIYPMIKDKQYPKKLIYIIPTFLGCMLSATLLELLTSYLMEWTTGSWPWQTYVDYDINFQARIALSPSIRFGIGGVVFLYLIQPLFDLLVEKFAGKKLNIISLVILGIVLIDLAYTLFLR